MRKIGLLAGFLLLAVASVMADSRPVGVAQQEAERFLNSEASAKGLVTNGVELKLCYTLMQPQQNEAAAYMFQVGNDGGYVLVSADDNARTILGYSTEGTFDANNIPENMQIWLQHYAEEIAYAANYYNNGGSKVSVAGEKVSASSTGAISNNTSTPSAAMRKASAIQPLLGGIAWNQGEPFWNMCPYDSDGKRSYTGCVATGAAQIMRFWKHPETGKGSHSYTWTKSNGTTKTLSVDFSASTYNWANMRENYNGSYTTAQANAVAKLMYDVGVSCDMGYSSNGSGTQTEKVIEAMFTYFGYDAAARAVRPEYEGQNAFEEMMFEELKAGRPVLMSGATTKEEGHCFVCDGYDGQRYFHINWGWGGYQNDYFSLSALDPAAQGMGGAASGEGFSVDILAAMGIQPDQGGKALPAQLGCLDFTMTTNTTTTKTANVSLLITKFKNIGIVSWQSGYAGIGIFAEDGGFLDFFSAYNFSDGLDVSSYYPELPFEGTMEDLKDGNYTLRPIIMDPKTYTIEDVRVANAKHKEMAFTVSGNTVTFNAGIGDGKDYTISNLTAKVDGDDIVVSFESEAPNFHVKVYNSEKTAGEGIVDYKNIRISNVGEGTWTVWVRPVDEAKENYVGEAVSTTVTIKPEVDYSIRNLSVKVEGSTVSYSFNSDAPYFGLRLYNDQQTFVNTAIDKTYGSITNVPDGEWTLWLRPVDERFEYFIGDAVSTTVVVDTRVIDYSIQNLTAYSEESNIFFNFESDAPYFHIKIMSGDEELLSRLIDYKNVKISNVPDGEYMVWVRPVDEPKEYYLADAATAMVTVDTHSGISNVSVKGKAARKYIKNGNVLIEKNERVYTPEGLFILP